MNIDKGDVRDENTIVLNDGGVEYAMEDSVTTIDDLIAALESAKGEGAKYVTLSSGNHRGAQWTKLYHDWNWAGDV